MKKSTPSDQTKSAFNPSLSFEEPFPERDSFIESLGLDESRVEELAEIINDLHTIGKASDTKILSALSYIAQTPAELSYMSYVVGRNVGMRDALPHLLRIYQNRPV